MNYMKKIPFYLHDLGDAELGEIKKVLAGTILTTGDFVKEFELQFSRYLGCSHAVACMSCTGAIHISLLALGVGPGDEVITTPMTFIATSTAIIQAGAKPVFVDVEPGTGNLNAANVEAAITPRTRAIMPVHLYGQMCDMKALRAIADRHGLFIIEDAAHCVEGERDGMKPGQLGDTACFSFFATKNLACGEGGAVVTNDEKIAGKLRLLRSHGMTKTSSDREREGYQHWDMVCMGWKYNMDNIHASMLLPQLQLVEERAQKRQHLAQTYFEYLKGAGGISHPIRVTGARHANHLFTVWVAPARRDHVIHGLISKGVGCVVNYRAIHLLTYFRETLGCRQGQFPVAEGIGDRTISLPLYCRLQEADVRHVARLLKEEVSSSLS